MSLTLMIPLVSFAAVAGLIGVLAFVLRDGGPKPSNRLDVLSFYSPLAWSLAGAADEAAH